MSSDSLDALDDALLAVPAPLRRRLLKEYANLKAAFVSGQYEACGLHAGRFCEVMLRLLQHELTGAHNPLSKRIANFRAECNKLEQVPANRGPEGLRLLSPRALDFLYTLRNKRDFGHVGGDVDANAIDAITCVRTADWLLSEFIRTVHKLSIEEAQELLDKIAERQLPQVWNVAGKKRVLDTSLSYPERVLLLLYSDPSTAIPIEDLFDWTEHSNLSVFKRDVLRQLHGRREIELDGDTATAIISPAGVKRVETAVLPRLRG